MRLDSFIRISTQQSQATVIRLLAQKRVKVNGVSTTNRHHTVSEFCRVELDSEVLQCRTAYYLMLNKPCGYLSATRDAKHPTALSLIKKPFQQDLHIGGRLDLNSTGLLLLTNDGNWSRRITEPGLQKPKAYRVETRDPITLEYAMQFANGVYLEYEDLTTQPAELDLLEPNRARLTIYEGRYHQVKRMFAKLGNRVISLHRERMGDIYLDPQLGPGAWRPLTKTEISSV